MAEAAKTLAPEASQAESQAESHAELRAQLAALPEHKVGEILGGELIVSPRPAARHANASSALGGLFFGPFSAGIGGPGGWWILDEPELHLEQDILVPDLAGWRKERMPRVPDVAHFELRPDWVCEILSSSTARDDRVRKVPIYAREGVPHVWLLDPLAKTLEVLRLDGEGYRLAAAFGGDEAVRAEPFDAIELPLGLLWIE